MEQFSINRGLTCEAIMWGGDGAQLVPFDEQHAFRYEVRNQRGNVIGFISADRALTWSGNAQYCAMGRLKS